MSYFSPSPLAFSIALVASIASITEIYAAESVRHYVIPSGTLSSALIAASQQSKQPIVFNSRELETYRSNSLEGNFTLEQVLDQLLSKHDLTYSPDSQGGIIVRPVERSSDDQAEQFLSPIMVYGERSKDIGMAAHSTTTTRTNSPLKLTPQAITVINSEIMDAQGARTVSDALKNVSGVTVMPSSLGSSSVNIRGYQSAVLSEGLSGSSGSTPLSVPAIALQSVETLKGPSAILSGAGSPGGTINLIYKKPELEAQHEIRFGYGSYGERVQWIIDRLQERV